MDIIDLRSDTVTHPTLEMREAMANAVVGDDVYGEDPTVNQLETEAAAIFGMEAGLFVTSGTQGNLIALLTHVPRGGEIIVGDKAHIFLYEQGGCAAIGGIVPHILPVQNDGTLLLNDIEKAIRGNNDHFPRTRLISIENTQGTVGGTPLTVDYTRQVAELAHKNGLKFHIDGARIFNAAAANNVTPAEMITGADSMTFCLSKGLGAPAGSILVGSKEFITEARRMRKILGGGMRQAGILAAAGLIAIHKMSQRLQEDHDNAARLAAKLEGISGLEVLSRNTNFVFFNLLESANISPENFIARLKKHNIMLSPYPGYERKFRAVLHYWISTERVDEVVRIIKEVLKN
jgi:threonine aldolase